MILVASSCHFIGRIWSGLTLRISTYLCTLCTPVFMRMSQGKYNCNTIQTLFEYLFFCHFKYHTRNTLIRNTVKLNKAILFKNHIRLRILIVESKSPSQILSIIRYINSSLGRCYCQLSANIIFLTFFLKLCNNDSILSGGFSLAHRHGPFNT